MTLCEAVVAYNERHSLAPVALRTPEQNCLALALSGELDMQVSTALEPVLDAALRECPARGKIVLDLRLVGYISSTGVGLLATAMVEAGKRSVTLSLANIAPRVRNIIDTLGLLPFFHEEDRCE
jgi:anti-anti-sigma factor